MNVGHFSYICCMFLLLFVISLLFVYIFSVYMWMGMLTGIVRKVNRRRRRRRGVECAKKDHRARLGGKSAGKAEDDYHDILIITYICTGKDRQGRRPRTLAGDLELVRACVTSHLGVERRRPTPAYILLWPQIGCGVHT